MKFLWEALWDNRHNSATHRAKVIGGWIVHSVVGNSEIGTSMVFVPDPNHEWEIG